MSKTTNSNKRSLNVEPTGPEILTPENKHFWDGSRLENCYKAYESIGIISNKFKRSTVRDIISSKIHYNTAQETHTLNNGSLIVKNYGADRVKPLDVIKALNLNEWNKIYNIQWVSHEKEKIYIGII